MTLAEIEGRVEETRAQLAGYHAMVDGAALCEDFLRWLRSLDRADEPLLTLTDAERLTGYSADHLGRLVRSGKLKNHGRRGSPRVRLSECPRRAVSFAPQPACVISP